MDRAAWPASMMNGMGKRLRAVRSVRTKPGQTVVTCAGSGEVDAQRLQEVDLGCLGRSVGLGAGEPAVTGYGGGVGDVHGEDEHVPSRHLPKPVFAAGRDRDGGAAACELACHGGANAARCADDPGGLPVQLHAGSRVIWSWLTPR
jgi:hypothetical protein